jgi:hypothetical protein
MGKQRRGLMRCQQQKACTSCSLKHSAVKRSDIYIYMYVPFSCRLP